MRFTKFSFLALLLSVFLFSCGKEDVAPTEESISVYTGEDFLERGRNGNGNGAPSGSHYTLNIIGVPKDKTADMTGNNGHRIFVDLEGNNKILLTRSPEGEDFAVLDANATDGRGEFQLPAPTDISYTIHARPLGTPGGSASLTTCGEDPLTGDEICSMETEVFIRERGGSKFVDITKNLTQVTALLDCDGDGIFEETTIDIFDDCLQNYLWDYDNSGLKLLQLRFYY